MIDERMLRDPVVGPVEAIAVPDEVFLPSSKSGRPIVPVPPPTGQPAPASPIHANVSLDPGPLRYLIGALRLHHWHHEIEHSGRVNLPT